MRKSLCLSVLIALAAQSLPAQEVVVQEPDLTLPSSPVAPYVVPILVLGFVALFAAVGQE